MIAGDGNVKLRNGPSGDRGARSKEDDMATEFKVGDTVQLRSGGPKMTIEQIGDFSLMGSAGHDQAKCVWFDGTKDFSRVFEFAALTKDDSPAVETAGVPRRRAF
jgi:uncharacterized protein YodC (DUF2158 family)